MSNHSDKKLTILLYHGVTRSKSRGVENYSKKHISQNDFFKQMKYIKKKYNLLSIDDVVEIKKKNKKYPAGAVVVSFDDGFKNNFSTAAPILLDLKIPAVFYITSGVVNTTMMFWVDSIEDCINLTTNPGIKIYLDKICELSISNPRRKILAIERIKSFGKKNGNSINRIIADLIDSTGVVPSIEHAKNYEKITWKDLAELNSNKLFTIGGHSLYHDILADLNAAELDNNLELSIKLLENNLNRTIKHYSYPEGQDGHYNHYVIKALKRKGIICCPTAKFGLNSLKTDLFDLKRIMVGFMGTPFPL